MIRTSNRAGALAYTTEHVIIAEQKLGRKLNKDEVVHHINGVKSDNHPENLWVGSRREHGLIHKDLETLALQLVHAGKIIFNGTTYTWGPQEEIS